MSGDPVEQLSALLQAMLDFSVWFAWLMWPAALVILGVVARFVKPGKGSPAALDRLFARAGLPADETSVARAVRRSEPQLAVLRRWPLIAAGAVVLVTAPLFFFVGRDWATGLSFVASVSVLIALMVRSIAASFTPDPAGARADIARREARASDFVTPWFAWLLVPPAVIGCSWVALWLAAGAPDGGLNQVSGLTGMWLGGVVLSIALAIGYPFTLARIARTPRRARTELDLARDDVLRENRVVMLSFAWLPLSMLGLNFGPAIVLGSAAMSLDQASVGAVAAGFALSGLGLCSTLANLVFMIVVLIRLMTGRPRVMRTLWSTPPQGVGVAA